MEPLFSSFSIGSLDIACANLDYLKSCSLGVYIPVGSRHELLQEAGISHFIEHMLFKGTKNKSATELARHTESLGISTNAYTTEEHTLIEMQGLATSLPQMVELICEMVWSSSFLEKEIQNETLVIQEEIIEYFETPSEHIYDLISAALWKGHPLGRSITGTHESVDQLSRDQLIAFHQKHYTRNIKLAVAGDIDISALKESLHQYFPSSFSKRKNPLQKPTPSFDTIQQSRDTDQANIAIAFPTGGRNSHHRIALRLISLMLGETMGSILFQKIREELGLCYSIQSELALFEDVGSFNITTAVSAKNHEFTTEHILNSITKFAKNGPTTDMLNNAKQFAIIQNTLALEGSQSYMQWIGDSICNYNKMIHPAEVKEQILSVTEEQIMDTLEQTFCQPHAYAAILPD